MDMIKKTEAQKKAQKKYMMQYVEVKVRMTPDKRTIIQDHATKMNESATTFINRAIDEAMERDNESSIINDKKTVPNTPEATPTKSTPGQSKHRTGDEIDRFLEQCENKGRTAPDTSEPQSIERKNRIE